MANGTKTSQTIGALPNTDATAKCCFDAEYGIIYYWNSANGLLYAINVATGVATSLVTFGAGEQPNMMTEPTSAGKIWTSYSNTSFPCRIWNITDRVTGAGNITTSPYIFANQGTSQPVFYHRPTHTNYLMMKSGNNLFIGKFNLNTLATTNLLQASIVFSTAAEYPQFSSFCKVGEDLIVGSCRLTGTNPYQLFVYNILTNTHYWLDNYYSSANSGTNLLMHTMGIFSIGNTVNFYNKGYKYTYDFNQEVTKPDINAWSRTSHSLSGAGYDDSLAVTYNTTAAISGNTYMIAGTYNTANQNKIVKASYFLPPASGVHASLNAGKVQLTWIDNSDEESFYIVERKSNVETEYTQVSTNFEIVSSPASAVGQQLTWIDQTADILNFNYSYKIKARYIQL